MLQTINIALHQRVVVHKHGLPTHSLGPGRHRLWGGGITFTWFDTSKLIFRAPREVRDVLDPDWFIEIEIADNERGLIRVDGQPKTFLRPGVHRFWTIDGSVTLDIMRVDEPIPELSDELRHVIPSSEFVDVQVSDHERGLHYVQGRFMTLLDPGRHRFWSYPGARVAVTNVDMRRTELALAGQELMTRDKVTLRLSLAVEYAVVDPVVMSRKTQSARDSVYLLTQLVARDYVAGVVLDELLEGRDEMRKFLEERTRPRALELGLEIVRIGIKDVVLPGDMKALLNRVIEAEKEAAANVILRREETAATRSLANTARVMADNPVLLRLRELDALKDMAAQIDEVRLIVGSEGLQQMMQAKLLTGSSESGTTG